MADLDDFFAKKDRKKSKSSKKFATTDEVAKKLEDNAKKTEKKKERAPEGDDPNAQQQEQDEWKDFEEEKKDYSGLKIGNLTINPAEQNSASSHEGSSEQQDGGEGGTDADRKNTGPWKRIEASELPPPEPEPPKPVVVEKPEPQQQPQPQQQAPQPSAPRSYVPPSLRNQGPGGPPPLHASRLRSRAAPDIHNEEFFPTLAKSSEKKTRNEGSFEVVQHGRSGGYRQVEQSRVSSSGPRLNLGNRYNTLSNDS